VFGLAVAMYGLGVGNPFVYISNSYANVRQPLSETDRLIFFAVFAVIGVTFSPIGEELFYRGLVHESLAGAWGNRSAAVVEAGAFAAAHLAHFGIVYVAGEWSLLPVPALLWVAAMFASALVFYAFRVQPPAGAQSKSRLSLRSSTASRSWSSGDNASSSSASARMS
jgi:membrane protease YdiL (CAAX protease family)